MKLRTALAAAAVLTATDPESLLAQRNDSLPAFNGLRTPVSPAFVVLGITPTAVERPNTPSDLAISALNHSAALTSLPRDIAVEFSPYWLLGHPKLTWQADATRSVATSIARTLSLSFATAELGSSANPVTGLALGLRAAPFSGRLSRETIEELSRLDSSLTDESVILGRMLHDRSELLKARRSEGWRTARSRADTQAVTALYDLERKALTEEITESPPYVAAVEKTEALIRELAVQRQGFVLEIAAGAALAAPGAAADSAEMARWGAWITAGYEGPAWSFVFVNRFLASAADSTFDGVDLGMRVIYTTGRYALSAEGLFRTFTEAGAPKNEYRFAAVVDFELQRGLWLTGTFGRDYVGGAPGSLLAQFGLSMNVAGERVELPKP